MYNTPQDSYPPPQPDRPWNGRANNAMPHSYPPTSQNPVLQGGENWSSNAQQGPFSSTQNGAPQASWGNGTAPFQQGGYPPPHQPPPPGFVYGGGPSRRSGLVPSRGRKRHNFSMVIISGATALALIVGLALFITLSNQGQKSSSPIVQTDVATPTTAPATATPTLVVTTTPVSTPTMAATPTMDTTNADTTPTTYTPPPAAVQQPAPQPAIPTPKPVAATPKPVATPTIDPGFSYDYNAANGTLVTNPPADFCTPGHEAHNFNVMCVADFFPGNGYVVTCADNKHVSHNGGNGACTQYKGEGRKWYQHPLKK